jgi:anti-anti-sigma factor
MELREERVGDVLVVELKGRLDTTTAPTLEAKLTTALAAPATRLIADMRQLDYISSAGFRVLLIAAKRADETGARFALCGLSGKVRQLFELGGFLDLVPISASREDALAAMRA